MDGGGGVTVALLLSLVVLSVVVGRHLSLSPCRSPAPRAAPACHLPSPPPRRRAPPVAFPEPPHPTTPGNKKRGPAMGTGGGG